ncbi:MAG TPA: Hpt domain-containing protein [Bacteroidota bacterium]|nr:Hpt domain-containing protein [Bacteroidota bacterium]
MMTQAEYEEALVERLTMLKEETDVEFVYELVEIYMAESPKMISSIRDAILKKDFEALRTTAHTLKGSSYNLGAKRLGDLCFALETAGRAKEQFPPLESIDELQKELNNLQILFDAFKKKQSL